MKKSYVSWMIVWMMVFMGINYPINAQSFAEATSPAATQQNQDGIQKVLRRMVTFKKDVNGLKNVLKYIETSTGINVVFRKELVHPYSSVHAKAGASNSIKGFLTTFLRDLPLSYTVSGDYIIIMNKNAPEAFAQDTVISGQVRDAETNKTMVGVNIVVKGTYSGISTNKKGRFQLVVPNLQDTLQVTFVGYQRKDVPIEGRTKLKIFLKPKTSQLSETVVNGKFERKAESYTGSQRTISNDELERAGNDNVFQALKNIDPSFVIKQDLSQGSNPNALPKIQLRGQSTFLNQQTDVQKNLKANFLKNPNQPLFILDGFETSVEQVFDLDLDRIRSITILKDASAKALYGSQAANGVVVIETKKLYATQPVIHYNSQVTLEAPDLSSYNLTNAREKLRAEKIDGYYEPNGQVQLVNLDQLYNKRRKLVLEGLDTDWMAKPLRNSIGQNHSLSVELGDENLKLLGNLSYKNSTGVMEGSHRQHISGNVKASYRIKKVRLRNNLRVAKNNSADSPFGTFNEYARMNPYWRAVNPDGSIPYYAETGLNGVQYTNPLYNSTLNNKITSEYTTFRDNFYLEYRITPRFKTTARVGIMNKDTRADEFYPGSNTRFESYGPDDKDRKGSYQLNNGSRNRVTGELNVNYSHHFGKQGKHLILANAGVSIRQDKYDELYYKVEGFPSGRLDDITFGLSYAKDTTPKGENSINRELGAFGVFSYSYDERYLADLTLRSNASSQFGAEKRWAKFWSLGLGWNIHNEKFMENVDFIDRLKIRGSLGSTGNQNFSTNASIGTYNYYLDASYNGLIGSYVQNLANAGLQWEKKFDYNAGFDAEVGNLTLRFDYYDSFTKNLVTDLSIPSSTGFNSVKENIGKVENKGIEIQSSYRVWSSRSGFLTLNGSITTNHNEIIDLSNALKNYNQQRREQAANRGSSDPPLIYQDGRSIHDIWAVRSLGIDPSTGNEIYLDRDGNITYQYDPQDVVPVGNSEPTYRGTVGFNGEYHNIGLSAIGRFFGGGQIYNQTLVDKVENVNINYNVDRRVLTGRWLHPGDHALYKRLGTGLIDTNGDGLVDQPPRTRPTSRFVEDYSQFTIGAATLYYDFPQHVLSNIGLQRLKLGLHMNEVGTFSSVRIERGTQYPFSRTFSFSLSATF